MGNGCGMIGYTRTGYDFGSNHSNQPTSKQARPGPRNPDPHPALQNPFFFGNFPLRVLPPPPTTLANMLPLCTLRTLRALPPLRSARWFALQATSTPPSTKPTTEKTLPHSPTLKTQIYLDAQSTTPIAPSVAKLMHEINISEHQWGNPHSRTHAFGWEAEKLVETARKQVAELIGADPKEIIFTSGATESNNIAVKVKQRLSIIDPCVSILHARCKITHCYDVTN